MRLYLHLESKDEKIAVYTWLYNGSDDISILKLLEEFVEAYVIKFNVRITKSDLIVRCKEEVIHDFALVVSQAFENRDDIVLELKSHPQLKASVSSTAKTDDSKIIKQLFSKTQDWISLFSKRQLRQLIKACKSHLDAAIMNPMDICVGIYASFLLNKVFMDTRQYSEVYSTTLPSITRLVNDPRLKSNTMVNKLLCDMLLIIAESGIFTYIRICVMTMKIIHHSIII